ncbi:MAG: hypothetical protein A3G18_07160 [Rhodospirillales bacterium RIFCSPLOWO2_12_FULL_58_28]|nr:MAG: hypothetical protein A3H92_11725 [Rhodospirillales bacterium RIFCSPLOWO2_02_FULL_58_16]OHC78650.1 MAG: hypothetical protein A3G18_07160 [Rhodospirillales bacterium RIFCSPLOWO2_12_FULL_58_28]
MKILLVIPDFGRKGLGYNFPLGIAYVSSALKDAGCEVHCLNLNHRDEGVEKTVTGIIRSIDPDVFATGSLSPYFSSVKHILAISRQVKPSIVNIIGGGIFSSSPDAMMRSVDVDVGVIGEGEETMVEVMKALEEGRELSGVNGIMYKRPDGTFEKTAPRTSLRDLSKISWPDYEGFQIGKLLDGQRTTDGIFYHTEENPRAIPMISSRSCPYNCSFCFHPTGRLYRVRDLDDFFAELDHLVGRYKINMIEFYDELFSFKKKRLEQFCGRIKPYRLKWMVSLHVSVVEKEIIEMMKDAGCTLIGYGVENMAPEILKSMHKKATREQIEKALAATFESGVTVRGNFIFGDPAETLDTANCTLDWWARNRRYQISPIHLQVLPGSEVYHKAALAGRIVDDPSIINSHPVNITSMDDGAFMRLQNRISLLRETLLLPAKILRFEKISEEKDDADELIELFDVDWECLHCKGVNNYSSVAVDSPFRFQNLCLTCRSCGAFVDVQNLARPYWHNEEAEALYEEGVKLQKSGNIDGALKRLRAAASPPMSPGTINRYDASLRAALLVGNMALSAGRLGEAEDYLSYALLRKAYDPVYHMAFAMYLVAEGSLDAARLHYNQARLLGGDKNPNLNAALDNLGAVMAKAVKPDAKPRYIC